MSALVLLLNHAAAKGDDDFLARGEKTSLVYTSTATADDPAKFCDSPLD